MLLSVVHQLSTYEPVYEALHLARRHNRFLGTALLEECLEKLASKLGRVSLVVDALDEIPTAKATQEVVEKLARLLHLIPQLSLLTTSRPEEDILDMLRGHGFVVVPLDPCNVNHDIATYVGEEIKRSWNLRKLSPSLQQTVITTLGNKADGMFVFLVCLTGQ
jgi:hypothetical protein